ncbi:hypothetical protein B808_286 [Fructilactobacillus florum 8D]|uniref:Uncharacterized protein n=1 Tax=Fructilactobacillus florum 8D TaxID=1221538 RepID=W9EFH1_9LACO|nr:hypothetical protein B807_632 [Fructilactobacillus florum 2F]ETO40827.1 hypothetical protein B808_286 [Fructilactobacillus florum 8D]
MNFNNFYKPLQLLVLNEDIPFYFPKMISKENKDKRLRY